MSQFLPIGYVIIILTAKMVQMKMAVCLNVTKKKLVSMGWVFVSNEISNLDLYLVVQANLEKTPL